MFTIVLILGLGVPAFTSLKNSKDVTASAYDIAGTLEQARAYAMANRTYVWVGFFEEDGSRASVSPVAAAGVGRVVLGIFASKDGTRYRDVTPTFALPMPFGAGDPSNPVTLVQLNRLVRLENTHLIAANVGRGASTANVPDRPVVDPDYQMGDPLISNNSPTAPSFSVHYAGTSRVKNPTLIFYPLGSTSTATAQYTFTKTIEFNPQGEASKIVDSISGGTTAWMEIAVVPTRGSLVDPRYRNTTNAAAIVQVGGLNGRVRIFRQ